ncbi:MAG TPA: hypothetical protein DEB39_01745 [Planctomycetaceae bacterium]|nr:hypothetical protein [Planctomycetaceae bacterium]
MPRRKSGFRGIWEIIPVLELAAKADRQSPHPLASEGSWGNIRNGTKNCSGTGRWFMLYWREPSIIVSTYFSHGPIPHTPGMDYFVLIFLENHWKNRSCFEIDQGDVIKIRI